MPEPLSPHEEAKTVHPLSSSLFQYFHLLRDQGVGTENRFAEEVKFGINDLKIDAVLVEAQNRKLVLASLQDISSVKALERSVDDYRHKTLLIASASHELRAPITGVISMLELMGDSIPESILEYYNIAQSSSKSLLSVVNDVLVRSWKDYSIGFCTIRRRRAKNSAGEF